MISEMFYKLLFNTTQFFDESSVNISHSALCYGAKYDAVANPFD
jgi:hypothetical protein